MTGNFTDILSNEVVVALLREAGGVQGLLRDAVPSSALPAFIHETTHHWCFLSPVGTALAALVAESDLDLWRARTRNAVIAAARDRVVAEQIRLAYQPIAEGIALFAQFNMRASTNPSAFGLALEPCIWVAAQFVDRSEGLAEKLTDAGIGPETRPDDVSDAAYLLWVNTVNAILDRERLREDALAERARLSQRPLDTRDNGYLPEYLLIKRAFNQLLRHGLPPDPNSFLSFAKQFFFHDTELALAALALGEDTRKSVGIFDRLDRRLGQFQEEAIVSTYEDYVAEAERQATGYLWGRWTRTIPGPLDLPDDGDIRVHNALCQRGNLARAQGEEGSLEFAVYLFRVSMRDLIDLATVSGRLSSRILPDIPGLSVDQRSVGLFVPDPVYDMQSQMLIPIGFGHQFKDEPATLDILIYSPDGSRVLALYVGHQLVHHTPAKGTMVSQNPELVRTALQERKALRHNLEAMQAHAEKALGSVFDDFDRAVRDQVREQVDEILKRRLFPNHPSQDAIFQRLRDRGLFEIFDHRDRPHQLARFSATLASGLTPNLSEYEGLLAWVDKAAENLHWPIVEFSGDTFLSCL